MTRLIIPALLLTLAGATGLLAFRGIYAVEPDLGFAYVDGVADRRRHDPLVEATQQLDLLTDISQMPPQTGLDDSRG